MRLTNMNTAGWQFATGFDAERVGDRLNGEVVELPHTAEMLPLNYFDETVYQRDYTYQIEIAPEDRFDNAEVALVFDGAMADARVWVNGSAAVHHRDGYTPFEVRLTGHLEHGARVTVCIDGSENPEVPPFGGQIDYLTYAGIYRDVWLRVTPPTRIRDVKIETPGACSDQQTVTAAIRLARHSGAIDGTLTARLLSPSGTEIARQEHPAAEEVAIAFQDLAGLPLWSPDNPALHVLDLSLATREGEDRLATRFGLREIDWTPHGFHLNRAPLKLIGLNRHQSFPYSGYAQGRRSQERDAEILKHELGCNIVRTSHYPQSPWFLGRCDEIGLLVFEEIPGWQHIGDRDWKAESVANVGRMIERDWNHPSIVIWGVRINESGDDHDFYAETNALARHLDPTRPTGGVRFIIESEMLEDVYTMNDFILGEFETPNSNRPRTPLRPVPETTGLARPVPYIVTEYNGHMFPTKAGDPELRRAEHVIRHLEVLNAAWGNPQISGAIGWCFFDYNTHKDFGAGDRICHHGVSTIFREPKWAAHAYASQKSPSDGIVLEPCTVWARGERNIGGILPLIVLTNCDEVEFRYGDTLVKRVQPDRDRFAHLPYPPIILDQRHFTAGEMGRWGMTWLGAEIIGLRDGVEVARRSYASDPVPDRLEVSADTTTLDAAARDEVRVIFRALDQVGNPVPWLRDRVQIVLDGPVSVIGPDHVHLEAGTAGAWLRATGGIGQVTISLITDRFAPQTLYLSTI